MSRVLWLLVVVILSTSSTRAAHGDDSELLQGSWETEVTLEGKTFRVVKTLTENKEVVDQYDGDNLVHQHEVEFTIDTENEVRVFRYQNGIVTAGARKGQAMPDGAFLYRIEGDYWIAVFGMLKDDKGPVYSQSFRRIRE